MNIKKAISKAVWYVKYHTTHCHHLIDLRQPKNRDHTDDCYHYGWTEVDKKIVLAMFKILCDYIEKDLCFHYELCGNDHLRQELQALYKYWKHDRLKQYDDIAVMNLKYEKQQCTLHQINDLDIAFHNKETEMLMRLINIRQEMWC